jgi:two-component system, NtrC family, nitrogen regulation response regulator GlnG
LSKLLVVDDEQSICWGLTRLGESLGHEVVAASSAEQAFHEVERQRPDAVILDVRLPGMDGLTAIERFQRQLGNVPIIVITAYGDLRTAVEAVRRGAFDYIAKPFDVEKVKVALVRALVSGQEKTVNTPAPARVEGMVGSSPAMQEVYKRIALAAACDASVLLTGETGTGKELAARAIHRYSRRASEPFVTVNFAAQSPLAAESELFGHVRGAFSGADEDRVGRLVQAQGGTAFLDEVSEIPLPTQVKLLRALENHEVVPVGGSQPVSIDFRVIAATRHDLIERANAAQFRHDLLFRLGAFQIHMPALDERREDIADLASYFIEVLTDGANEQAARLTAQTLSELERRPWHGNIREFRHAIEHALIVARGPAILPEHLPPSVPAEIPAMPEGDDGNSMALAVRRWAERSLSDSSLNGRVYDELLDAIEPPLLDTALRRHRGQCAAAARTLGIHRTTLRKKLTRHGLGDDEEGDD